MVVVDDALLLAVLTGQSFGPLAPLMAEAARGELFTTGSWYWRLARALANPGTGALSRVLVTMSDEEQRQAETALRELPDEIGLLSLRRLVPVMRALPGQLNLLTAEAVAAAVVLNARIVVTTDSPLLAQAARSAGVTVEVITLAT